MILEIVGINSFNYNSYLELQVDSSEGTWTSLSCVLSHFSHVQLFATAWTVAHQTPLSWDSPGMNTGVCCYFLLQGIFLTQG